MCFFLSLSVWAKAPTLPATFFPVVFFSACGRFREAILFVPRLLIVFAFTSSIFFWSYGFKDTIFILFEHLEKANMWGDRVTLFPTSNETWIRMGYYEGMPLLFRYFVMYLTEYWYIAITCIVTGVYSWRSRMNYPELRILTNLCIIYCLSLPPCLAALAHYGSVENSLLFANTTGILILLSFALLITSNRLSSNNFLFKL